jgi:hypothetical protein
VIRCFHTPGRSHQRVRCNPLLGVRRSIGNQTWALIVVSEFPSHIHPTLGSELIHSEHGATYSSPPFVKTRGNLKQDINHLTRRPGSKARLLEHGSLLDFHLSEAQQFLSAHPGTKSDVCHAPQRLPSARCGCQVGSRPD